MNNLPAQKTINFGCYYIPLKYIRYVIIDGVFYSYKDTNKAIFFRMILTNKNKISYINSKDHYYHYGYGYGSIKIYLKNSQLHNDLGPALYTQNNQYYYINNKSYCYNEWGNITRG